MWRENPACLAGLAVPVAPYMTQGGELHVDLGKVEAALQLPLRRSSHATPERPRTAAARSTPRPGTATAAGRARGVHPHAFPPSTGRCALCEREADLKNLAFLVSHAAVQRLRSRWGAPQTPAARSIASIYDGTRVCVFCN